MSNYLQKRKEYEELGLGHLYKAKSGSKSKGINTVVSIVKSILSKLWR